MQIIRHSERIERVEYSLVFDRVASPGSGFAFDCDEHGNVSDKMHPVARANYEACLTGMVQGKDGPEAVRSRGIRSHRWTYREPAVGRCECGREVTLANFTNACDCGRDYNSSGQLLAPREQWGEETGEHWTECV